MGKTSIEWTDASWNPVTGCNEASPGCANCYAARLAATRLKNVPAYKGLAIIRTPQLGDAMHTGELGEERKPRWTGEVRLHPDRLEEPLHWREPRKIFVCDMSDLFHEDVTDKFIKAVWNMMAGCQQHTFQVLTKRPGRMRQWVQERYSDDLDQDREATGVSFAPLPNVWLGVSVENQHFADERIPLLLDTPSAVRFISAEPLLGSIYTRTWLASMEGVDPYEWQDGRPVKWRALRPKPGIDWVICGGESGPGARAMHPDWARSLRDQCQEAGVPFFFKQWGEWSFDEKWHRKLPSHRIGFCHIDRNESRQEDVMFRVGKKKSGRLLDGRTWDEFPNQLR